MSAVGWTGGAVGCYICIVTQIRKQPAPTPKAAAGRQDAFTHLLEPELFRALGDPTRLALLACLSRCARECSVSEIAGCCSVDLSVVSRHLGTLERAGLVSCRREGRAVLYAVRLTDISERLRALAAAFEACCPAGSSCDPEAGCC